MKQAKGQEYLGRLRILAWCESGVHEVQWEIKQKQNGVGQASAHFVVNGK